MNKQKVDELLNKAFFKFAKTMANIPHSYTVKKTWDSQTFLDVVKFINENGVKERFYSKFYTYYYANGYKYWTMDDDYSLTVIINRAK